MSREVFPIKFSLRKEFTFFYNSKPKPYIFQFDHTSGTMCTEKKFVNLKILSNYNNGQTGEKDSVTDFDGRSHI